MSMPTAILIGILLGLAAVAANGKDEEPSSPSERGNETSSETGDGGGAGGGSGGSGGGSGSAGDSGGSGDSTGDDGEQGHPDTGSAGVPADGYALTLTFDDGPHPKHTQQVLELLEAHDAKAVFCVVGQRVREHPELVRKVLDAGHALCNHTETHDSKLSQRARDEIEDELSDTEAAIDAAAGEDVDVPYFRQPSMHIQPQVLPIAKDLGYEPLNWTVDPRDWSEPGTTTIVRRVLNQVRPGAVVLLHDGGGDRSQTVAALKQILTGLDAAGYRYVMPGGGS